MVRFAEITPLAALSLFGILCSPPAPGASTLVGAVLPYNLANLSSGYIFRQGSATFTTGAIQIGPPFAGHNVAASGARKLVAAGDVPLVFELLAKPDNGDNTRRAPALGG